MATKPTPASITADLTVPERLLLFCLASDADWQAASITHATAQHMMVRGLIGRDIEIGVELSATPTAKHRLARPVSRAMSCVWRKIESSRIEWMRRDPCAFARLADPADAGDRRTTSPRPPM
jgi:hypothetical protein